MAPPQYRIDVVPNLSTLRIFLFHSEAHANESSTVLLAPDPLLRQCPLCQRTSYVEFQDFSDIEVPVTCIVPIPRECHVDPASLTSTLANDHVEVKLRLLGFTMRPSPPTPLDCLPGACARHMHQTPTITTSYRHTAACHSH